MRGSQRPGVLNSGPQENCDGGGYNLNTGSTCIRVSQAASGWIEVGVKSRHRGCRRRVESGNRTTTRDSAPDGSYPVTTPRLHEARRQLLTAYGDFGGLRNRILQYFKPAGLCCQPAQKIPSAAEAANGASTTSDCENPLRSRCESGIMGCSDTCNKRPLFLCIYGLGSAEYPSIAQVDRFLHQLEFARLLREALRIPKRRTWVSDPIASQRDLELLERSEFNVDYGWQRRHGQLQVKPFRSGLDIPEVSATNGNTTPSMLGSRHHRAFLVTVPADWPNAAPLRRLTPKAVTTVSGRRASVPIFETLFCKDPATRLACFNVGGAQRDSGKGSCRVAVTHGLEERLLEPLSRGEWTSPHSVAARKFVSQPPPRKKNLAIAKLCPGKNVDPVLADSDCFANEQCPALVLLMPHCDKAVYGETLHLVVWLVGLLQNRRTWRQSDLQVASRSTPAADGQQTACDLEMAASVACCCCLGALRRLERCILIGNDLRNYAAYRSRGRAPVSVAPLASQPCGGCPCTSACCRHSCVCSATDPVKAGERFIDELLRRTDELELHIEPLKFADYTDVDPTVRNGQKAAVQAITRSFAFNDTCITRFVPRAAACD